MTDITSGYDDPPEDSDSPTGFSFEINEVHIGTTQSNAIYVNVLLNKEVIGAMRLPNKEALIHIREALRSRDDLV